MVRIIDRVTNVSDIIGIVPLAEVAQRLETREFDLSEPEIGRIWMQVIPNGHSGGD